MIIVWLIPLTLMLVLATAMVLHRPLYDRMMIGYHNIPQATIFALEFYFRIGRGISLVLASMWLLVLSGWCAIIWPDSPDGSPDVASHIFWMLSRGFIAVMAFAIVVFLFGRPKFLVNKDFDELWQRSRSRLGKRD